MAYLVPSVPVKYLDTEELNMDVPDTLQMMYYEQVEQAQLFSLSDAIEVIQKEVKKGQHLFKSKMTRQMTDNLKHMRDLGTDMKNSKAVFKMSCEPFFL